MANGDLGKWRAQETYFRHSWSHIYYLWKVRKVMLGKTTLQVLRSLPPGPRRVIDLGSGPGSVIFDIADVCGDIQEVEWFGLDLNLRETREASERNAFRVEERQKKSVNFVVGDLFDLPFADASIDLLVSTEVVEHLPDPRPALQEMARVLKPGAFVLITTPNPLNMPTRVGHTINNLTGGALKKVFWKGHDTVSAPPLSAEVGFGHVSVHPYGVWRQWMVETGFRMVRKVRGPAVFGGPFFDRHPFLTGTMVALDPLLDKLPFRFLLSENLGMLCQKNATPSPHPNPA